MLAGSLAATVSGPYPAPSGSYAAPSLSTGQAKSQNSYANNPHVLVIERQSDQSASHFGHQEGIQAHNRNLHGLVNLAGDNDNNNHDDHDGDDPTLVNINDNNKKNNQSLSQILPGLYVSTSESNYAIVSPELAVNGWLSVSVNEDEVFIVSLNKKFQAGNFQQLVPMKKENLRRLRAKFLQNLQGLQLNDGLNSDGSYYSQAGAGLGNTGDFIRNSNGPFTDSGSLGASGASIGSSSSFNGVIGDLGASNNYNNNHYNNKYPGWCTKNYYENTALSNLNKSLDGDIYFFDSYGNQLNIFSSTVNTFCRDNLSIVFRDQNYFAYSRQGHHYNWLRVFVSGTNVFIIYQDGTVLAKPTWALESSEFNSILRGRTEVKQLVASQNEQARENCKQLSDPKMVDIVDVVKSVLKDNNDHNHNNKQNSITNVLNLGEILEEENGDNNNGIGSIHKFGSN